MFLDWFLVASIEKNSALKCADVNRRIRMEKKKGSFPFAGCERYK
jgi:hypothetical protein